MAALWLAHVAAGIALIPVDLPVLVKLVAWTALTVSLVARLSAAPPAELTLDRDGRARMRDRSNEPVEARVTGTTVVLGWLVVLRLATARGIRTIVLPPDSLARDGHRRLRVALRWPVSAARE